MDSKILENCPDSVFKFVRRLITSNIRWKRNPPRNHAPVKFSESAKNETEALASAEIMKNLY